MLKPSDKNSWKLATSLLSAGYPDFLALNSWPSLAAALVPTFKNGFVSTPSDPSALENKPGSITERREGLFTALLGDPRILYYELLEDPARFEDGVSDLIQQMVAGTKSINDLTPNELQLLDRAVIDWSSPRHPVKEVSSSKLVSSSSKPSALEYLTREEALADPDVELEYREDGKHVPVLEGGSAPDLPEEPPSTFWWRS